MFKAPDELIQVRGGLLVRAGSVCAHTQSIQRLLVDLVGQDHRRVVYQGAHLVQVRSCAGVVLGAHLDRGLVEQPVRPD